MKSAKFIIIALLAITSLSINAKTCSLYDQYPNGFDYYYGITGSDALGDILVGKFHRWEEHIQSVEYTRTLANTNWFRKLVRPLTNVVQIGGNITLRQGRQQVRIIELNPYFMGRWENFPWQNIINTSFAIGEGISYASSVPTLEKKSTDHSKRLLNFLLLEATLAFPKHPTLQLIIRIHHRSGAYGLYNAGNTGSNNIGLGLRYLFD